MKMTTLLTLLLISLNINAETYLKASYQIKTQSNAHHHEQHHADHDEIKTSTFELWRAGKNQVIHRYPDQQVAQHWTRQKNQRVKLIKLFESHERGIEYEASEIQGHQQRDWSEKYQLLNKAFLASMTLEKTTHHEKFGKIHHLSHSQGDRKVLVEWLPTFDLIKSIRHENPHSVKTWTLVSVEQETKPIKATLNRWDDFYLTDYADIGDNESDPFLMNMINLGFIEAAASGFYNDKGQAIQGQHKHVH